MAYVCIQYMPMGVVTEALHVGCTGWLPSVTGLCLARDRIVTGDSQSEGTERDAQNPTLLRLTAYSKLFAVDGITQPLRSVGDNDVRCRVYTCHQYAVRMKTATSAVPLPGACSNHHLINTTVLFSHI
jgi:hypothetical protein